MAAAAGVEDAEMEAGGVVQLESVVRPDAGMEEADCREAEICSVKKNAGRCWPAGAGMEGAGNRKAEICFVKK